MINHMIKKLKYYQTKIRVLDIGSGLGGLLAFEIAEKKEQV